MSTFYPRRLSLANCPTPLELLPNISRQCGTRIWVKRDDLTGSWLSGNKVRKLEFTLAEALDVGANVLITCGGLQSNHCRATALLAARLGLECHLILRGELEGLADGNLLLDELAGATISVYPEREYFSELDKLFDHWVEHYRQAGRQAFTIPTGASDGSGVWGYLAASEELKQDFERLELEPEYIVCATGSGGTQAGLTLGCHKQGLKAQVVGMAVCDNAQWFNDKVREDLAEWSAKFGQALNLDELSVRTFDDYIGPGYAMAEVEVFDTIRQLARSEGLLLDPVYTAKAFYGMLREIDGGRFAGARDIVFVHTGGMFGLYPFKQHLLNR